MAKPKPDHREQVEVKLGQKERTLLDDFQMTQTFKAGGGIFSDLGQGIGSVIGPFVNGGDAGLLMALIASVVVDNKLDGSSDEALQEFIDNTELYTPYDYGVYPDWRTSFGDYNFAGPVAGTAICFCDPADFPAIPKHWKTPDNIVPPWVVFDEYTTEEVGPVELYNVEDSKTGAAIWDTMKDFYQGPAEANPNPIFLNWTNPLKMRFFQEFGSEINPERSGPWRSLQEALDYCFNNDIDLPWQEIVQAIPALTYDDPPPSINQLKYGSEQPREYLLNPSNPPSRDWLPIFKKYRLVSDMHGTNWEMFTTTRWNNAIDDYREGWRALPIKDKMIVYSLSEGPRRAQMTGLTDLLGVLQIPGAESVMSLAGSAWDLALDAAGVGDEVNMISNYRIKSPYCQWPAQHMPPNSLYKYETIHLIAEGIKIAIPWYLGTKLAVSAAGAIIPG